MNHIIFLILSTFIFVSHSYAEILSIPLQYTGHPAKDLVGINGKPLSVIQAKIYWAQTEDLSNLNPKENDVWKNNIGSSMSSNDDDLSISDRETFKYVDNVVSTIGSFRFVGRETNKDGNQRNFNIWMSKDNRSILLRKNLLRKLGYKIPKIEHKQQVKIKFNGEASLKGFISDLEVRTFADSNRWIIGTDKDSATLTLQDVLVFESNTQIYNLAMGEMNSDAIKHRRSMNTLALPYALVDVRESVDGLSWNLGRIDNKVLLLDILAGDQFSTTYNDAVWMMKQILKLSRSDFEQVVEFSYLPISVKKLMVEKLISRRNTMAKVLTPKAKLIEVNYEISDDSGELKRGRLTRDTWEGHSARYSYDDTESPLSREEIGSFFKSKFYASIIQNVVTYVNDNLLYDTDIQAAAIEKAVAAQRNQFIELFETGQFKKVPFSTWVIPTAKGNIAASRDIVTGLYLGTDNLIQIADSVEVIGEVGAFVGTLGLPAPVQLFASGGARFSRSYSHVKSIKSIKKALREPFRNIMVPRVKKQKSRSIIGMIDDLQSEDYTKLEGDEREEKLTEIFKEFEDVMEVGDSLIISNNLILSGGVTGGYQIPSGPIDITAMVNFNARKLNIWRLHILRADDKTFQVYKSRASSFGRGGGIQLKAIIPVLTLNWDKNSGQVKTQFQSISFSKEDEDDVTIKRLTQLRQVFVDNSTELLTKENKPFVIEHNFTERTADSRFFAFQTSSVNLLDKMMVTHPEQFTVELYIRSLTKLKGRNYTQVAYDVLNGIIEEVLNNEDIMLSNTGSGNPGDSFYGESFSRQVMTEVPFNHLEQEIPFENYSQVKSLWKGWKANRKKLKSIKKKIQKKYGRDIFNDELFFDTDEIQLYSVDVTLSLYTQAIDSMIAYDHEKFMKLIDSYIELPMARRGSYRFRDMYERKRKKLIRKIRNAHTDLQADYQNLMSPDQKSTNITTLIDVIESMLPFNVFQEIVGGDENFYLKGTITGFRTGTENGEEALISNAIGEYGSEMPGGIMATLRSAIKISQGELGAYWFLRRLQ